MSEGRQEILQRIRATAAPGGADARAELESLGQAPAAQLDADNPVEAFVTQALLNKASLELASDRSEVVRLLARYVYQNFNTHRLVAGYDPRLAALPWRDGGVLVRFDAAVADDQVAVSYARLAVAEAGSVCLYNNRGNPGSSNWLVQDHLVVVDIEDIVENYEMAWERIAGDRSRGEAPRGIHFIAGPSSTGDIIGHLVTGAHGPIKLHMILRGHLDDELRQRINALLAQ